MVFSVFHLSLRVFSPVAVRIRRDRGRKKPPDEPVREQPY